MAIVYLIEIYKKMQSYNLEKVISHLYKGICGILKIIRCCNLGVYMYFKRKDIFTNLHFLSIYFIL